jgi:hypothetical protein
VIGGIRAFPLYPLAFVAALLISEQMEFWVPVTEIIRPFLVIGAVTLAVQLILARVVGPDRAAFVAASLTMGAFDLQILVFPFATALVFLTWASIRVRRLTPRDWRQVTRVLSVVSVVSLLVAALNAAALGASLPPAAAGQANQSEDAGQAPDVYLILLDGYPRADTLSEALDFDNSGFLESMETLGFDVASDAHSNYNRTILTVASMLNARPAHELVPEPPQGYIAQHRHLAALVESASGLQVARGAGYEIVVIPTQTAAFTHNAADRVIDSGQLTQLEYLLPRNGALKFFFPDAQERLFRRQHRDRIVDAFDALVRLPAEQAAGPRLVVAHLLLPHHPVVFRSDGSLADVPECYWEACLLDEPMGESLRTGLHEQLTFTNERTASVLQEIVARSKQPPVIVVFGDHGFRHWYSEGAETYQSLFMSYTPGHPGLFPETATPINILPRILNAYSGTDMPLASEDSWMVSYDQNGYFPMRPWVESDEP